MSTHSSLKDFSLLHRWTAVGLVFVICSVATYLRFKSMLPTSMHADDLVNLLAYREGVFATDPIKIITGIEVFAYKFRPVFSLAMAMLFRLFEENLLLFQIFNIVLQGANAAIIFVLVRKIAPRYVLLGVLIAVSCATSRFGYYQITQATGPVEGLALTWCLMSVYCVSRLKDSDVGRVRWSSIALVFAFLAMNTHERYAVLFPWLALMFCISGLRETDRKALYELIVLAVLIPLFVTLFKKNLLDIPLLQSTGNSSLGFTKDLAQDLWSQAINSIFGANLGPTYLVGARLSDLNSRSAERMVCISVAIWVAAVSFGFAHLFTGLTRNFASRWRRLFWPIALLSLFVALLIPPTLTIRLEQRWEYAPFVVMNLFFAWGISELSIRKRMWSISIVFLACLFPLLSIYLDGKYLANYDGVFMAGNAAVSDAARRDIVEPDRVSRAPIALLVNESECGALRTQMFFRVYGSKAERVECFASIDDAANSGMPPDARFLSYSPEKKQFVDYGADVKARREERSSSLIVLNFLDVFSSAKLTGGKKVDSPSGNGAFVHTWPSSKGSRSTLTVISSFTIRFENIFIPEKASLRFGLGRVLASDFPLLVEIKTITPELKSSVVMRRELAATKKSSDISFEPVEIDLSNWGNQRVSLEFAVTTPGPDDSGHWVGFSEPRIVAEKIHNQ